MSVLLMTVSGAFGAAARYGMSGVVQRRSGARFPAGTAAVNLLGAFAAGVVAGAASPGSVVFSLGVGSLGGFTTFSTWMVETLALTTRLRAHVAASANLAAVLAAGVALAALGYNLTA